MLKRRKFIPYILTSYCGVNMRAYYVRRGTRPEDEANFFIHGNLATLVFQWHGDSLRSHESMSFVKWSGINSTL